MLTGDQHREARVALGYTQTQWGELLGVTRWSVMNWESGRHPVPQLVEWLILERLSVPGAPLPLPWALPALPADLHEECEQEMDRLRGVLEAVAGRAAEAIAGTLDIFETKRARDALAEIAGWARAAAEKP